MRDLEALQQRIAELDPTLYPLFSIEFGDAVMAVDSANLLPTMRRLKDLGFDRLGMVTAVDRREFLVIVYRLHSRSLSAGLFVKTKVRGDEPRVDSVFDIWPAADWQEREVYDMFGVVFDGHPDLRRILLPEEWVGFPQRKSYEDARMLRRPDYI